MRRGNTKGVIDSTPPNLGGQLAEITGGDSQKAEELNDDITLGISVLTAPFSVADAPKTLDKVSEIIENGIGILESAKTVLENKQDKSSDEGCTGVEGE